MDMCAFRFLIAHMEKVTGTLRFRKYYARIKIISTPVILCNVIFSYYNICKKDQSRYIYISPLCVSKLVTSSSIMLLLFVVAMSTRRYDTIYIYIHFIYIFIYIYLYFSLQFIYIYVHIFSYLYIYMHSYLYSLFIFIYIY